MGDRVIKHYDNANNWRPKSLILDHWMSYHGAETSQPKFKFKMLEMYPYALRRQLPEDCTYLIRMG